MNGEEEKRLFQTLGEIKATTAGNSKALARMERVHGTLFEKNNENATNIAVLKQKVEDCSEKIDDKLALQNRKHGMAAIPGSGSLLWQVTEFLKGLFS